MGKNLCLNIYINKNSLTLLQFKQRINSNTDDTSRRHTDRNFYPVIWNFIPWLMTNVRIFSGIEEPQNFQPWNRKDIITVFQTNSLQLFVILL